MNTLRLLDAGQGTELTTALITPLGATLTNVGALQIIAQDNVGTIGGGAEALSTAGTLFSGVSLVSVTNAGNLNIAAGTGQALTVTNTAATGGQLINGGSSQTASITGVAIAGGGTGVAVTLGGTTATTGAVDLTVSNTSSATAGTNSAGGVITVNGGSTVEVNQSIAMTTAAAATLRAAGGTVTLTQGAVNVNGGASTTSVTVSQSAAAAAVTTAGSATAAIVGGAVGITDRNTASTADTITTVTLNNAGAATITSNALSTLNLVGQATAALASNVTLDASAGTAGATSMTINLDGGFIGTVAGTRAALLTTLNIDAGTDDSTIATLTAGAVTALNLSGDVDLDIGTATLASTATITSTNTSGVAILSALGNAQTFNGGTGDDLVFVGATTKAINMGAGDDTVVASELVLGTGGSLNGGLGNNTLVSNTNGSAWAANANVSNFQTLQVAAGLTDAAQGSHSATGFTALELGNLAGAVTFTTVAAGVGLTFVETTGFASEYQLASAAGTSDVLNVTLEDDAVIAANALTAAGIETVSIAGNFLGTTLAGVNSLTLTAAAATTVTVSGNVGLNLTATGSTAVTNFNASGVVGAAANAANLAVTYASLNATRAAAVSIIGGAGNDVLTGNISNDTMVGGLGNDTLSGGQGSDVIDGGEGTDTYAATAGQIGANVEGAGTGTSTGLVINLSTSAVTSATVYAATGEFTAGLTTSVAAGSTGYLFGASLNTNSQVSTLLSNIENVIGSTGNDYIVGSAGNNVLNGGAGADSLTGGSGNDTFQITSLAQSQNANYAGANTNTLNIDKITDFVATGTVDTINLGGGAAAFGTGITFTAATNAVVTAITVATAADFTALTAAAQAATPGTASTSANAQIYDITVSAGNLAGRYMIVNDNVAAIAATDTIISLTGITGALAAADFTFA